MAAVRTRRRLAVEAKMKADRAKIVWQQFIEARDARLQARQIADSRQIICAVVYGAADRRRVKLMLERQTEAAVWALQAMIRGGEARLRAQKIDFEQRSYSASVLQGFARGKKVRIDRDRWGAERRNRMKEVYPWEWHCELNRSVSTLQAASRGWHARQQVRTAFAAIKVQSAWRGHQGKHKVQARRQGVVMLQALVRAQHTRQMRAELELSERVGAAQVLQASFQGSRARTQLQALRKQKRDSAVAALAATAKGRRARIERDRLANEAREQAMAVLRAVAQGRCERKDTELRRLIKKQEAGALLQAAMLGHHGRNEMKRYKVGPVHTTVSLVGALMKGKGWGKLARREAVEAATAPPLRQSMRAVAAIKLQALFRGQKGRLRAVRKKRAILLDEHRKLIKLQRGREYQIIAVSVQLLLSLLPGYLVKYCVCRSGMRQWLQKQS